MKLGDLLKSSKDFQLNKRIFVNLRWIAILGQFFTISLVKFVFNFDFNFIICSLILVCGALSNLFLQFKIKQTQLNNNLSTIYLIFDTLQLGLLLFMTGGIKNPFVFLLIIPPVLSSTLLKLYSTINLVIITVAILIVLTFFHYNLPGPEDLHFHTPDYYLYAIPTATIIGLVFLVYFGFEFGKEARKRKEALDDIQDIIAKEHELLSLGGQAAAAAHSLGTPLSTITLIAKELKEELKENKKLDKDINLLISQSQRCNEILKKLTLNPHVKDEFVSSKYSFKDCLNEIIFSFQELSQKKFSLNTKNYMNEIKFSRSIELNYGLRNFIGNANKFSSTKIQINLTSDKEFTTIEISDDGPGFPSDIINKLGEPYIKSSVKLTNTKLGLGLGTFIGKTLLERNYGKVSFTNKPQSGAQIKIVWLNDDLRKF